MSDALHLRRRRPILWEPIGKRALDDEEAREERVRKRQKVHRSFEYSELESFKRLKSSGRMKLDSLEGAFRYLFENSDLRLGYMQKRLIDEIIVAFLKIMFGDDLVANLKFLSSKFMITQLFDTISVLFPRRSGKTVTCAVMIAVIAVSQPDGNSIMYNLTAAQAEEFISEVRKHLVVFQESAEYGFEIVREDVRRMIKLHSRKFDTINSIKSYACALKGDGKIDKVDSFSFF